MQQHGSNIALSAKSMMGRPVVIAIAVAVFGVLGMLLVDHGPWSRPHVQTADIANYKTTGEAARAVGATVTPTEPRRPLEPVVPGPKPAEPTVPVEL
jgi:hypothetical protein